MASIAMHIATANVHLKNFEDILNKDEFIRGVVAPDVLGFLGDKIASHYGNPRFEGESLKHKFEGKVNLNKFLQERTINTDYDKGYFLHLLGDFYFFNQLLYRPEFEQNYDPHAIYNDYAVLQNDIVQKYDVHYTPETEHWNITKVGQTKMFDFKQACAFVEFCGKLDLKNMAEIIRKGEQLPFFDRDKTQTF